jgi:hypothetical protein
MRELFNIALLRSSSSCSFMSTLEHVPGSVPGTSNMVSLLFCRVCGLRCPHKWHPSFWHERLAVLLFSREFIYVYTRTSLSHSIYAPPPLNSGLLCSTTTILSSTSNYDRSSVALTMKSLRLSLVLLIWCMHSENEVIHQTLLQRSLKEWQFYILCLLVWFVDPNIWLYLLRAHLLATMVWCVCAWSNKLILQSTLHGYVSIQCFIFGLLWHGPNSRLAWLSRLLDPAKDVVMDELLM